MKLFSFDSVKIAPASRISAIGRDEVLVCGVWGLGMILGVLIIWDAYLFYHTFSQTRESGRSVREEAGLSGNDIDEVIRLLDERREKFDLGVERKLR